LSDPGGTTSAARKRGTLRASLSAAEPTILVGAHDALTGSLIERHGFDGVWVSGLGVATMAYALPDLNLTTMTEALAAAIRIDGATNLPLVADCDNGYGGLSNVVRTVREYERAGIAGICVEDNTFPKRNSLYEGDTERGLIPLREQARRIAAAKRAQETNDFLFIARVEALIAGLGVPEACARASAYVEAGADAILIHSRDRTLADIEGFLAEWEGVGRVPLVSVPTLYPTYTADELAAKGFSMVIFANQPMRAAVRAMEETLATLAAERRAAAVDDGITPVDEIFRLVGTKEAIELEEAVELPPPKSD
jgi:phosphoenolpyruvate phosphomutase